MKSENEQKNEHVIQWHPAFFAAIQLIFRNETAHLEFESEHTLNTKPLLVDVLVIKKPSNETLKNPLGFIFRGYNIIEYKSPQDQLGIDTYFKTYAYACLYKASGEHENSIKMEDVTITLVRDSKPEKLLIYLKEHGYQITNPYSGIYYVENTGMFRTQIVVGKELQDEELVWLKAMAPNAGSNTLISFMQMAANELNQGWKNLMESVLGVVCAVNQNEVEKLKGGDRMCEALREIMKDEIKEIRKQSMEEGKAEGMAQGKAEGMAQGKAEGMAQGMAQGIEQNKKQSAKIAIQSGCSDELIMKLTGWTQEVLKEFRKSIDA